MKMCGKNRKNKKSACEKWVLNQNGAGTKPFTLVDIRIVTVQAHRSDL